MNVNHYLKNYDDLHEIDLILTSQSDKIEKVIQISKQPT